MAAITETNVHLNIIAMDNTSTTSKSEKASLLTGKPWPPEPAVPGKHGVFLYLGILLDVTCVLAAVPFLVLAGIAANRNGQVAPPDEWELIYTAMNVAVTIFPLVNTAILTRTIRALAGWKLERGATLGILEQLWGSQSLVGALQMLWSLWVINVPGLLLIVLIIIPPIGGQASLQMLKIRTTPEISQTQLLYVNTREGPSRFEAGRGHYDEVLPAINTMFGASLTASPSIKNSTMDLWNNVKIPYLSQLNTTPTDESGWKDVPSDRLLDKYSSLIGIPARGVSASVNTSYNLETTYFDLSCHKNIHVRGNSSDCLANNRTSAPYRCYEGYAFKFGVDSTFPIVPFSNWLQVNHTYTARPFPPKAIRLESFAGSGGISVAYCNVSTAYVEATVNCTGLTCAVTRMRPSTRPHPPSGLIPFSFIFFDEKFFKQLAYATFPGSPGSGTPRSSQLTEFFLNDPMLPFANTYRVRVDLFKLPLRDLSIRLGQVVNSYYLASVDFSGITGTSSNGSTSAAVGASQGLDNDNRPLGTFPNSTTVATVSVNRVVYVCRWGWWAVFVLACAVMIIEAGVGAFLNRTVSGPDILGYVSSLTRDSPYVEVPEGGGFMDSTDLARCLKDLKVQIRDVRPDDEVGYLAFSTCTHLDNEDARVKVIGRVYK